MAKQLVTFGFLDTGQHRETAVMGGCSLNDEREEGEGGCLDRRLSSI